MIFLILAVMNIISGVAGVVVMLMGGSYSTIIAVLNFMVGYLLYRIWMMRKIQEQMVDTINEPNPDSGEK